ncbi:MAG: hypothetical protein IJZ22_06815 [Bacteroidaceae bacterium]|nr:hypothetical protein [Bacteroidaceae bacterium]
MNKLVFNEGGQPVHLEDLRLLQDNMKELVLSLFLHSFSAGYEGMTDDEISETIGREVYATARHKNGWADANTDWIQPHKLITKDGVYDVDGIVLSEGEGVGEEDLYYLLKEEVVESRIFEDGQERPVIVKCTAQIVSEKPASGIYYRMKDVLSFDELLEKIGKVKNATNAYKSYYAVELMQN